MQKSNQYIQATSSYASENSKGNINMVLYKDKMINKLHHLKLHISPSMKIKNIITDTRTHM